jgi:hypothetical protein
MIPSMGDRSVARLTALPLDVTFTFMHSLYYVHKTNAYKADRVSRPLDGFLFFF